MMTSVKRRILGLTITCAASLAAMPTASLFAQDAEDEINSLDASDRDADMEETSAVPAAPLPEPTRVTLTLENAEPGEALTRLTEAAGKTVTARVPNMWDRRAWPRVTLSVVDRPLWEVALSIADHLGVTISPVGDALTFNTSLSDQRMIGLRCISGPFLIVANRIDRSATLTYVKADPRADKFEVSMTVFCEPGVRIVSCPYQMTVVEARDDAGNSLQGSPASQRRNGATGLMREFDVSLSAPSSEARRIASLKGYIDLDVQQTSHEVVVADLGQALGHKQDFGVYTVSVTEVAATQRGRQVVVVIDRGTASDLLWRQVTTGYSNSQPRFTNADGQSLTAVRLGSRGRTTDQRAEFTVSIGRGDEAEAGVIAMNWPLPDESRRVRVPIEFKDLPIP